MSFRPRLALALITALVASMTLASPASAQTWSHTDPARDMYGDCSEPGLPEDCPAAGIDPTRLNGDFRTTWVNHGADYLVVRSHFSALSRPHWGVWDVRFTTNESRHYRVQIHLGEREGYTSLVNTANNTFVSCSGLRRTISYANDTIEVRVPRRCLSYPSKVSFDLLRYIRDTTSTDAGVDMYSDRGFDVVPTEWIARG